MAKIKEISSGDCLHSLPANRRRRRTHLARSPAGGDRSVMTQTQLPEGNPPLRRSTRVRRRSHSQPKANPVSIHTSVNNRLEENSGRRETVAHEEGTIEAALTASEGTRQSTGETANHSQSQSQFVFNWVRANYQYESNHNVPRSGMYEHYLSACAQAGTTIQPVNSATFGKLIRHVFAGISTRRLGTRGQSSARRSMVVPTATRFTPISEAISYSPGDAFGGYFQHSLSFQGVAASSGQSSRTILSQSQWQWRSEYAPYMPSSEQIVPVRPPEFATHLPDTLRENDVAIHFAYVYERHCFDILESIRTFQINNILHSIVAFYHTLPDAFRALIQDEPLLTEAIWCWDCWLYDTIILTVLPTIYAPLSHSAMFGLRQLTMEIDRYIATAMQENYPSELCQKKITAAQVFVSKFRRNLKLNQMGQIVSNLLHQKEDFDIMIKDWRNIDFLSVLEQAFWVCECDSNEVVQLYVFRALKSFLDDLVLFLLEKQIAEAGWTIRSSIPMSALRSDGFENSTLNPNNGGGTHSGTPSPSNINIAEQSNATVPRSAGDAFSKER
ncbi:RFX DNA-binding domain-containing protein [Dichotomocladium elegans]|nr:RFX DNA-binding domain-containing protein [Dichotomocladium elegans]